MKKRMIELVYKVVELLPKRAAEKIKMLGCVLFGDWHFFMPRHPNLQVTSSYDEVLEKVNSVFRDFPEEEVRTICRYVRQSASIAGFPFPENGMLYNYRNIARADADSRRKMEQEMQTEIKNLGLKVPGTDLALPEVLFFHHGLCFAGQAVKDYIKGKVFIDAGAFVGDSALMFAKYYSPGKICSFEPSEKNREYFLRFMKKNKIDPALYDLQPYCLGAERKTCRLCDCGEGSFIADGKAPSENASAFPVEMVSIDELFLPSKETVGVIKADVEGFGLDLVKGAAKLIERDLPVLCLAVYHNEEELLGVCSFLRSLNLPYEYHVQALSPGSWPLELTFLAFPAAKQQALR